MIHWLFIKIPALWKFKRWAIWREIPIQVEILAAIYLESRSSDHC